MTWLNITPAGDVWKTSISKLFGLNEVQANLKGIFENYMQCGEASALHLRWVNKVFILYIDNTFCTYKPSW